MGGQQFAQDAILLDMRKLCGVLHFNGDEGWIDVEAGIQWPELIDYLIHEQQGRATLGEFARNKLGSIV